MTKATKVKQLQFMLPDRAGRLSEITAALVGAKVNITNICAYGMQGEATFMLTVDSNAKAKKALKTLGVEVQEHDVVSVEMPKKTGEAGINIFYLYGTSVAGRSGNCIFTSSDDAMAIKLINKK